MKLNGYTGTITVREDCLYRDGHTDYRILIPAQANEAERFAARELTDIFARAGVTVATVTDEGLRADPQAKYIALGNTVYFRSLNRTLAHGEFKFDGFIIETLGNTHIIKGVGDTGTCFGVYGFAEYAMGWMYYWLDEQKIDLQAANREFHIKDIPTFFSRSAYSYFTDIEWCHHPDSMYTDDHSFRLRVNGQFSRREKKHGEGCPWSTLNDQSLAYQIMPFETYMQEHPDWYYVDTESTDPFYNKRPQICFSKAMLPDSEGGFFDTFMSNLINNFIIPESDKSFFMLGISDNRAVCDCPACKEAVDKYMLHGLNMRFVNKVADAVEDWRKRNAPEREIYIITFAYYPTIDPPVRWDGETPTPSDESVVARDNVIVRIAPIMANYRYDLLDKEHNLTSRKSLLGWSAIAKHLMVWDYRSDFGTLTFPFPSSVTAQANHDIYLKFGMMEVLNQAEPFSGGQPFLKMDDFARSRMHWNGKESYEQLTDEFRKVYYRDAEPIVTEYLRLIESSYAGWVERGWTTRINSRAAIRKYFFTVEEMYRHKEVLDRALAAAKAISDPEIAQKVYDRVNELTLFYKFVLVLCFPTEIPKEEALALIEDLRVIAKQNEMYYFLRNKETVEDWLDDAKNIVLGVYPASERKFKLKQPDEGPF